MKAWGRIITAMVTPFDKDLEIDLKRAAEFGRYLVSQGVTALVIAGTTGEAPTLSAKEKIELFRAMKDAVNVPIIAGVGTNGTKASIDMAIEAEKSGVDGLLVVVPYYNKPTQKGLYQHFKTIAESTKLPLMLYNVPGRTSRNLDAATTVALSKVKNITCVKEASGDLAQMTEILANVDDSFALYTGVDDIILPTLAIGGYGVVSVSAHVVAPQIKSMLDAYLSGENQKAARLHQQISSITKALFVESNPIPVKYALKLMGQDLGGFRLPMTEPEESTRALLQEELKKINL